MTNLSKNKLLRLTASILLASAVLIGSLSSCDSGKTESGTESSESVSVSEVPTEAETTTEPETAAETTTEPDSTEQPLTDIENIETSDTASAVALGTTEETVAENSSVAAFVNPLTGIPSDTDLSKKRPVAIMINNLRASLPQVGISSADILYECLVEGGTTRLMAVVMNYESLGVIGSVRSSREYYLDFAANHDAIYVHAGGSTEAYSQIKSRGVNNLDGVNMYLPSTFYRDAERRKTMSLEHTLMTTGEGIVSGIEYKNYRTTIKDGFVNPLTFCSPGRLIKISGDSNIATHVIIPYNTAQFPQYIYEASTRTYKRYQFNGIEHIDGGTGAQLRFTNLIIIACDHYDTGDEKGHLNVNTAGSGDGWYITGGKYTPIKWSKPTVDSQISMTFSDGSPLKLNCGKTMINIVSDSVMDNIVMNYKK